AKALFVEQGKCGVAFEPENEIDLVDKTLQLYNDRELVKTLGDNGLKYASENFNRDKIAKEFYDKLQTL
ncbi:MAG: hypothetical protein U0L38_01885, partial [Bacteroidales bacterium]|nr:hypothetical protein [Bacteroidales bacterium]